MEISFGPASDRSVRVGFGRSTCKATSLRRRVICDQIRETSSNGANAEKEESEMVIATVGDHLAPLCYRLR
ncbi:MAG: hypothetical protein KC777_25305 [Cyanobacteria bacterium HKST-UBA02]|nr:hypothetical protein [Cyanobacteria bacterium HKST-UBA02]